MKIPPERTDEVVAVVDVGSVSVKALPVFTALFSKVNNVLVLSFNVGDFIASIVISFEKANYGLIPHSC